MKQHRALNPFQFKDEPVTKQEESLIAPVTEISSEGSSNYPYGQHDIKVPSLQAEHRTRLKIRLGRKK